MSLKRIEAYKQQMDKELADLDRIIENCTDDPERLNQLVDFKKNAEELYRLQIEWYMEHDGGDVL